jgi:tyrosine-protein phosphatase SIW14
MYERAQPARRGVCVQKFLALIVALLFSIVIAKADVSLVQAVSLNIPNFGQVDNNFYRGGMPNEAGLQQLRDAGVKTIVSLANERKYVGPERAVAKKLGMQFIYIPMSAWREPSQNQIDSFLSVVNRKDEQPVFVHCVHGEDRTGAMVAIYRMQTGWSEERAYQEMLSKGFHRIFLNLSEGVRDFAKQASS